MGYYQKIRFIFIAINFSFDVAMGFAPSIGSYSRYL